MASLHVGCCITAHGFGHAARTMAVMEALARLTDLRLTIASQVPKWFLQSSYTNPFSLFPLQTDVGLVQNNPLEQNIPETLEALPEFYPLKKEMLHSLSSVFAGCSLVICDVSPAGILAARESGVPSVLIENFTWDWIYKGFSDSYPKIKPYIAYLKEVYDQADYRIQTMPVCKQVACDILVQPVARLIREGRSQVRRRLGVGPDERMVLLSMGGIGTAEIPLERMQEINNTVIVVSGYTGEMIRGARIRLLRSETDIFHPDLVGASDAVVGKVGYSTLAEVYHADVPFGFISRQDFREAPILTTFIQKQMPGIEIDQQSFRQGSWIDILPQLLSLQGKRCPRVNGAVQCAEFLLSLAGSLTK